MTIPMISGNSETQVVNFIKLLMYSHQDTVIHLVWTCLKLQKAYYSSWCQPEVVTIVIYIEKKEGRHISMNLV